MLTSEKIVLESLWIEQFLTKQNLWDKIHKVVVDVGCGTPFHESISRTFIENFEFEGILIDALESNIDENLLHYMGYLVRCVCAVVSDKEQDVYFHEDSRHWSLSSIREGQPNRRTSLLSKILDALGVKEIGIMSVDLEGMETPVLIDLLANDIRPQILVVESNEDPSDPWKLAKEHRMLLEPYYGRPVGVVAPNQIFIRNDLK